MPQRFFKVIETYSNDQILSLIKDMGTILDEEKNLVFIPQAKIMVVGDLHGDLETLHKIIQQFFRDDYDILLFLGDYVDRGAKQVEVINVLFYYKKILPERIILLRGNHEDPIINRQYGFYDQVRLKFKDNKTFFRAYNQIFSKLPLAAITWNGILCLHGGIPEGLDNIDEINELPNNQTHIKNPVIKQMLWNDPKEFRWSSKEFKRNSRGPGIKHFGEEAFHYFITQNKIKYVIRSHERVKNGCKTYFDEKLFSIFSSRSYSKRVSTVVGSINNKGNIDIIPI
jgi:predicted phosphodiesterase